MKLISDIINDLLDCEKSLDSAFLKTKVLASRIQNQELLDWVGNELKGYSSINDLPEYRKNIPIVIRGSYINGNMKYTNQPIPVTGLRKDLESNLRKTDFYQSISGLESLINEANSQTLASPLSAEIVSIIEDNWINMGNNHLRLIDARRIISKNSLVEIISEIRNMLLDFMLKIDSEFGSLTEIQELKAKNEQISTIMNQTVINNSGDGNVLNTGDKAKLNVSINIIKKNKEGLQKYLNNIGLSNEDTNELLEIIDLEEPNMQTMTFGGKVNLWMTKVLSKALDGTWNVGIGTAGTLLADAIKAYYGM